MRVVRLGREIIRFCVVGGAGLVIDAGGVLTLVALHLANRISGRAVSFFLAVCATFLLKRLWTLKAADGSIVGQTFNYISAQGMGFLLNFVVYVTLYKYAPAPLNTTLIAIAIASGGAIVINFVGSKLAVFPVDFRDVEPF